LKRGRRCCVEVYTAENRTESLIEREVALLKEEKGGRTLPAHVVEQQFGEGGREDVEPLAESR
jgi:hypothetical protein